MAGIAGWSYSGEVVLQQPEISFVAPHEDEGEFGAEVDWTAPLKELIPIQINRFAIEEGTIRYWDFSTEPQVEMPLHNVELEILNINNAENQETDYLQAFLCRRPQSAAEFWIFTLMQTF